MKGKEEGESQLELREGREGKESERESRRKLT